MVSVGDLPLSPGSYSVNAWVIPVLGVDTPCDMISDYPLFSIVKKDHIDHYNPPIPWGAVHCRNVDWNIGRADNPSMGEFSPTEHLAASGAAGGEVDARVDQHVG
jgi:hypothetical protein